MGEPRVSVVVGSRAGERALAACLAALEDQRNGAEVIVCESESSSDALRRRFGWATFVEAAGELVPGLWREGIDRSRGRVVALLGGSMVPALDWLETIEREHERHDVVAGAIEPNRDLRVADWAEYFCRYSPDMLPFDGRATPDLPGDNASYKRDLLVRTRELYRGGFWEPRVHRRLDSEGFSLWHSPALVVRHGRSAGIKAFVGQRLEHGRAHGNQRGEGAGRARNLARLVSAPLVAPVMSARILRHVVARRRLRLRALVALPLILLFNAAWAAGEARGHLDVLRGRR